ncbi:uncharacterized protein K452DRAFT_302372 [Aplosporella prunicola CBS 121167]|uniref:Zinc/iron permease n=1 Tax=Aplosporella prunicola CBS 121167 TaxID=1176127 RepID=A0A6A6B092_9PEZI|nr:uncharacterized protein K452DRAFT_302372 [Aplosporella prunicola CBS 121167]KAF2136863.1 hypothetical protein K452DRAFT_302372 [Aplosporella prunicola CBS 121167]
MAVLAAAINAQTMLTVASITDVARRAALITSSPVSTAASSVAVTAISGCHMHGSSQFCRAGSAEYQVIATASATGELPARYTGCHKHGADMFCIGPDGEEVEVIGEEAADAEEHEHEHEHHHHDHDHDHGHNHSHGSSGGKNCHFHAGVEYANTSFSKPHKYNVPLRIGLLFVILETSALAVFAPMVLTSFTRITGAHTGFILLKQFGTGVMISTAFVHLLTHANLMLSNPCIHYPAPYEATPAAIFMAGLFLAFLVEYLGQRVVLRRQKQAVVQAQTQTQTQTQDQHQHQHNGVDEEAAPAAPAAPAPPHPAGAGVRQDSAATTTWAEERKESSSTQNTPSPSNAQHPTPHSNHPTTTALQKMLLGLTFALITPLGMALGLGLLHRFNGNSAAVLLAIGVLDALSAGILAWTAVVEMLAGEWMAPGGALRDASGRKTVAAGATLLVGVAGMSLLGKWA